MYQAFHLHNLHVVIMFKLFNNQHNQSICRDFCARICYAGHQPSNCWTMGRSLVSQKRNEWYSSAQGSSYIPTHMKVIQYFIFQQSLTSCVLAKHQPCPALSSVAQLVMCWPAKQKRLPVQFLVRAHAWVAGLAPSWDAYKRQPINVSPLHRCFSPSFSLPSPLSKK